jgi:hypothetical protein
VCTRPWVLPPALKQTNFKKSSVTSTKSICSKANTSKKRVGGKEVRFMQGSTTLEKWGALIHQKDHSRELRYAKGLYSEGKKVQEHGMLGGVPIHGVALLFFPLAGTS